MIRENVGNFVLDNLGINELSEVVAIEAASFTTPWTETLFFSEIRNPRSVSKVIKIKNKVVGYICANIILDEGHILNLAVHQEFRNRGIATALIEEIIDYFRKNRCRAVFLEVRASNEKGKRIYELFNFKVLGTRNNYYISPVEDAILMVLRLDI